MSKYSAGFSIFHGRQSWRWPWLRPLSLCLALLDRCHEELYSVSVELDIHILATPLQLHRYSFRLVQADVSTLKLKRQRLNGQLSDARSLLDQALRQASKLEGLQAAAAAEGPITPLRTSSAVRPVRIVLICGFESFNVALYNAAAKRLKALAPHIQLKVYSDRDIASRKREVALALAGADCFFGSLLFDYDTVEWLRAQLTTVPVVLVFESALELMGLTRIGTFTMDPSGAVAWVWAVVTAGVQDICMDGEHYIGLHVAASAAGRGAAAALPSHVPAC